MIPGADTELAPWHEGQNPHWSRIAELSCQLACSSTGSGDLKRADWRRRIGFPCWQVAWATAIAAFPAALSALLIRGMVRQSHQLMTRMYMDFLRMEAEMNFLGFLPQEQRIAEISQWYRGADRSVHAYLDAYYEQGVLSSSRSTSMVCSAC